MIRNRRVALYIVLTFTLLWSSVSSGEELLHYTSHLPLKYNLTITAKSQAEALFRPGPVEEHKDMLTLSQQVQKVGEGLLDIAYTVDEINWEEHGPSAGSAYKREEILGNTGHIKVNLLGKVEEAGGIPHISSRYFHRDSLDGPPLDIYRALMMLYPQFPLRLLKKGDSWKVRDKILMESAEALPIRGIATLKYELEMTVKRSIKYTLIDYVQKNGHRAAHIGFDATFSTDGTIITESQENYTEGDGSCSGELYFSVDEGILLEVSMESEVNEMKSQGGRARHWFNPEQSITIALGGYKSTPITWLTKQEIHFELAGKGK